MLSSISLFFEEKYLDTVKGIATKEARGFVGSKAIKTGILKAANKVGSNTIAGGLSKMAGPASIAAGIILKPKTLDTSTTSQFKNRVYKNLKTGDTRYLPPNMTSRGQQ